MNKIMNLVVVCIGFLFCTQAVNAVKQPVRARKASTNKDSRPVTIKITTEGGNIISGPVTFKKNTDVFAKSLRSTKSVASKSLYFDFDQGTNVIEAYYGDDQNRAFGTTVSAADETPKEIIVDGYTLKIVAPIATKPLVQYVAVKAAQSPINGYRSWSLASGTKDMTASMAGSSDAIWFPEVLDFGGLVEESGISEFKSGRDDSVNNKIKIYKNQPTRIYAKSHQDNSIGVTTLISPEEVRAAGANPVLVINDEGKATMQSGPRFIKPMKSSRN